MFFQSAKLCLASALGWDGEVDDDHMSHWKYKCE